MTRHQLKPQPTAQERLAAKRKLAETPRKDYYLAQKYAALSYDYGQIDEADRQTVSDAALEIRQRLRRTVADMVRIGEHLSVVKELLPHGQYHDWLDIEFDMSVGAASEFRSIAARFADKLSIIETLTPTIVRRLAAPSVPDEAVQRVFEAAADSTKPIRVKDAMAIVKPYLPVKPPRPKQLQGPVAEPAHEVIDAEYTVVATPTFTDWMAAMPGDLTLREQMAILALAKTTALHALGDHPKLYNAVYGALPTWSHLIHEIEKRLKEDE